MARGGLPNGLRTGLNGPRRTLAQNPTLYRTIQELFSVLKAGNDKSAFEFSENLEVALDWRNGEGVLRAMSNPANSVHQDMTLEQIKGEALYLDELESIINNRIPGLVHPSLWKNFELVVVDQAKKELASLIASEDKIKGMKSDFLAYLASSKTPAEFFVSLTSFGDSIINKEQKKTYKSLIQDYKLSFFSIQKGLKAKGEVLSPMDASFSQWNDQEQLFWDGVLTQSVIGRNQEQIRQMSDLIDETGNIFAKVMPGLGAIFKKYPFNYQELAQKYPQQWAQITALQDQITENMDEVAFEQINKQIQKIELDLYLLDLQGKDPQLVLAIKHLIESDGDYTKLSPLEIERLIKELVEESLRRMRDKNLTKLFDHYHASDFENFFRQLYDLRSSKLKIGDMDLDIKKFMARGEGRNVQSLEDLQNMHQPPLFFEVSGFDQSKISLENMQMLEGLFGGKLENGTVKLQGGDIGKLFFLYLAAEGKASFEEIQRINKKAGDLSRLFDQRGSELNRLRTDLNKPASPENAPTQPQSPQEQQREQEEKKTESYQKLLSLWKDKVKGEKSDDPDGGLRSGAVLYFDMDGMESMLPPHNMGSTEKIRMEIKKVDPVSGMISFACYGTELGLSENQEGVEMTKSFDDFLTMMDKTSGHYKLLSGKKDSKDVLAAMKLADMSVDLDFKDGKILFPQLDEKGNVKMVEATHFSAMDEMPDDKSGYTSSRILYETSLNPDGTIDVKGEVPALDGDIKLYKKTMTVSDFIFFVKNKHLQAKTADQAEDEKTALNDIVGKKNKSWKWLTIQGLTKGVKSVVGSVKKKMDEYYKDQDDQAMAWLVNDFAIYDKIAKVVGFSDAAVWASGALRDEAIGKLEGVAWAPIESWLGKFEKMVDFATFFKTGKDDFTGLGMSSLGGKTLMQVLESGKTVVNDPKWRAIMAAAMLANLKKGAGLYRNVQGRENEALWIKCLLGDEHHRRYMKMKNDEIAKIEAGASDADQIQDRLKTSEIDYIINNINGADIGMIFGSVKDPDASLKRIYSGKFTSALKEARITTDSKISSEYTDIKHQNFYKAFNDFKGNIKSGRFEKGIAHLMKMVDLTGKNPARFAQVQKAFTFVVLSGMMNRYGGDKATRKMFDQLAVTLQIPTAFGTKKRGHRNNAWHLMDKIPPAPGQKRFSEFLEEKGLKKSDFGIDSPKMDYAALMDNLWSWWGANAKQVDTYFDSLFIQKPDENGNLPKLDAVEQAVSDQLRKKESDNVYGKWAGNPALMSIKGLQKGAEVFRANMNYDKNGFSGENADQRNDKAAFRKDLTKDLSARVSQIEPPDMMALYLKIFNHVGFSESSYPRMISYIRTARRVKKYGVNRSVMLPSDGNGGGRIDTGSYQGGEAEVILDYLFRGEVLKSKNYYPPVEFEKFLQVFVDYFQAHLDDFDEAMLTKIFGEKVLNDPDSSSRTLIPWDEYNKYKINDFWEDQESKEEKNTEDGKKKKRMYNDESRILNKRLVETEKALQRIGVKTASLSGVSQDKIGEFSDMVYGVGT